LEIKEVVGIDVGKEILEAHIHSLKTSSSFKNTIAEIKTMVNWAVKRSTVEKKSILFVLEHTGLYSKQLALFLSDKEYNFVMIPGLEIKRSLGISRGKSDKIDAEKIAQYGYRRREELSPYIIDIKEVAEIKKLLSLREKLVTQRAGYKSTLGEYKQFMKRKGNEILFSVHEKMIKELTKQIEKIESNIDGIVNSNSKIKKQYELIKTIKGVGSQTALFMIAYTNGFTRFQTWRKFASYCGIAPFPNSSGKSLKGKTKVSGLANKKIKSLLDMCAKTAIQSNPEMKIYYLRRVSEGKEKMSTINIIRNKLLSRIFAVVDRETPYVNTYAYCG
jgi:transposase